MKNHLKTLNLSFILAIFSVFAFAMLFKSFEGNKAFALDSPPPVVQTSVQPPIAAPQTNMPISQTIPQKNAYALTHMEQQNGFQAAVFKFFMAMLGVLVSALAIFLGLKIYQKFVLKNNSKLDNIKRDKTLESPKDFKEAINIFLDKTDK